MDWSVRRRCPCCGLLPAWFGCQTWCLCEPAPLRAIVIGQPHECSADRALHIHRFGTSVVEFDETVLRAEVVFVCVCGQERRLDWRLLEAS